MAILLWTLLGVSLIVILIGKRLFFGNSEENGGGMKTPVSVARRDSDSPELGHTPANRGEAEHEYLEEEQDQDLVMMQPKSLAATFDCFSDED